MDAYDNGETIMRILELFEGGWDTTKTQSTVITPAVVLKAESIVDKFITDFNNFLSKKGLPNVRKGNKLGSSAYAQTDLKRNPNKEYGDIDLQMIAPDVNDQPYNQFVNYWNTLADEFIKSGAAPYVDVSESKAGHPIFQIGPDEFIQVDFIWHEEKLSKWGAARATPEHNIKGLLTGNMWSTTGEILDMSIQHAGVQFKIVDRKRVPFSKKAGTQLVTISTDPETWILDIFKSEAKDLGLNPNDTYIDPLLMQNPGTNIEDVKIKNLANGIIGLARSFEQNDMFGQGSLEKFASAEDFLKQWWTQYESKALKSIASTKYDKAITPQAVARAEADREKILKGLEIVKGYFV